ncbi:MAG: sensor histidine kinase [Ardenticatenaceae bacterium]|nr:sensor histidine kinase [Ardenticatenaceae bacterium]
MELRPNSSPVFLETKPHPKLSTAGRATLLLGAACIAVIIFQGFTLDEVFNGFVLLLAAVAVAILVLLDRWLVRTYGENPPYGIAVAALVGHALLVEMVALADGLTYTSILYLTLPFPAFFMLGRRPGYGVGCLILIWLTIKFFIFKPDWWLDPVTVNTFTLLFVSVILMVVMAEVVQRERSSRRHAEDLFADLSDSHRQLKRYAEQVAELATVEERNRLARDIHDGLGHYLTVIGIQLEKARTLAEDDWQETLASIGHAKRMADQALTDVRESVRTLREPKPPFALRPALADLVDNVKDAPFTVDIQIKGEEKHFTQQQLMVLFRMVQEGLTNAQKHAQAQQITVHINLNRDEATLTFKDDGIGMTNSEGIGLRGLRERLELVSGRLQIYSAAEQGTTLEVHIPSRRSRHG